MAEQQKYFAFLRGINVGGHHKVPMADLKKLLEKMGFQNIKTLLNSGNVIFEYPAESEKSFEEKMAQQLEKIFGFPVPVLIRREEDISNMLAPDPFKDIEVTKDIRLYITFLKEMPGQIPEIPWISNDGSYQILALKDRAVFSVLDVSKTKSTDAMKVLGDWFGKNITTRNVNTVVKMLAK